MPDERLASKFVDTSVGKHAQPLALAVRKAVRELILYHGWSSESAEHAADLFMRAQKKGAELNPKEADISISFGRIAAGFLIAPNQRSQK